jgi:hypothetical protein
MRYVTSIERLGKAEGIEEGIEQGILQNARDSVIEVLETRFGLVPSSIVEVVNQLDESAVLKRLHKRAIAIPSVAEFEEVLSSIASQE